MSRPLPYSAPMHLDIRWLAAPMYSGIPAVTTPSTVHRDMDIPTDLRAIENAEALRELPVYALFRNENGAAHSKAIEVEKFNGAPLLYLPHKSCGWDGRFESLSEWEKLLEEGKARSAKFYAPLFHFQDAWLHTATEYPPVDTALPHLIWTVAVIMSVWDGDPLCTSTPSPALSSRWGFTTSYSIGNQSAKYHAFWYLGGVESK